MAQLFGAARSTIGQQSVIFLKRANWMKLWYVWISDIPRNMMLSQQAAAARMPVFL
jgi:hypothetical protein